MTTTVAATLDYEVVALDMVEILADLDAQAVAFYRWLIDIMRKELDRLGLDLPLVTWGQGFKDVAPAPQRFGSGRTGPTNNFPCAMVFESQTRM
jgi:phage terminase large subunit-like protein